MANYVTYFAIFIFMLFGIAFFAALQSFKKLDNDESTSNNKPDRERLGRGVKEIVGEEAETKPSRNDP